LISAQGELETAEGGSGILPPTKRLEATFTFNIGAL
jgi:hypothetical protein